MQTKVEIVQVTPCIIDVVESGPQGPTNVLTFEATPLPAGSDPTVDTTGESPHQHVILGIPAGDKGDPGPSVEIAVVGDSMCWRVAGTEDDWTVITPMSALVGDTGDRVELRISAGVMQWKPTLGSVWTDLVSMSTLKGDTGDYAQMRRSGANVEWKPSSASTWAVLFPLADIKGDTGDNIELRREGANVEWKTSSASSWNTLMPLTAIKGDKGDPGAPGEPLLVTISDQNDIGPGGWWITRDYHGPATLQYLRAEMLAGTANDVTINVRKNGVLHRGGIALSSAATIITDLALTLAKGDNVSVHRGGGTITGPWLAAIQIDGRA
ncbi:hypothetical protein GCM10019059_31920 [Camelimonas fluminis]|uniref:Minor tail protein n=1 Tax=Camelimonas fluminis TaxID=1576911 RepID=A0ABV7UIG2_9HYPH|nr:hypothetical protein [Camelimonas fluminis]GHE69826.1 hypothetical protein GCM10019059_31920 [Camelimonas fluminis]